MESVERGMFGDISAWTRRRETRQRRLEEDVWAGKGRKPTPAHEVYWAWELGMNKVFMFRERRSAQKNIVKEKFR